LTIVGHRGKYRNKSGVCQFLYKRRINFFHIPDKAVINTVFYWPFSGFYRIPVSSGQADGIATERLKFADYIFVGYTGQHHFHDFQSFGIGDPAALDHFYFDSKSTAHFRHPFSAAVNEDFISVQACECI